MTIALSVKMEKGAGCTALNEEISLRCWRQPRNILQTSIFESLGIAKVTEREENPGRARNEMLVFLLFILYFLDVRTGPSIVLYV